MSPRSKKRTAFEDAGRKVDRALHDAAHRLDSETERLVTYLNDEVVPSIRKHSSRGLRTASQRLSQFADYLDSLSRR